MSSPAPCLRGVLHGAAGAIGRTLTEGPVFNTHVLTYPPSPTLAVAYGRVFLAPKGCFSPRGVLQMSPSPHQGTMFLGGKSSWQRYCFSVSLRADSV